MLENKRRAINYAKGWMVAAGVNSIPPDLRDDNDFLDGWNDGRLARKEAMARAEDKYGCKFNKVRLCAPPREDNRPG